MAPKGWNSSQRIKNQASNPSIRPARLMCFVSGQWLNAGVSVNGEEATGAQVLALAACH